MRAITLSNRGEGMAGLTLTERPYPHAAENDVIVKVHAAGFTPGELEWPSTWTDRSGRDRTPSIPGHELSGTVVELGYGTTGLSVGQRVFGFADWARDGSLAEYAAVEARNLAPLPAGIDHVVGAALPISGVTAWEGLFQHARLETGQTVLVHGSAGGVGSFAVQLAKAAGAVVVATGREADRELALKLGAHRFVDLDRERLEDQRPVDVVLDVIGGDVLARSVTVVREGGVVVSIAERPTSGPVGGRSVFFVVQPDRATLATLARRVSEGALTPIVGSVRRFEEAADAFQRRARVQGKVIIRVTDDDLSG